MARLAELLIELSPEERVEAIDSLAPEEAEQLLYRWDEWARDDQLPPAGWGAATAIWWIRAGRGWGKTRTGAETVRDLVQNHRYRRIGLIGRDALEVRLTMIEGPSGLLEVFPPWEKPIYIPSRKIIKFRNGANARIYYGTEPATLRGPEHDLIWGDEPAFWKYPEETVSNAELGLRVGANPRMVLTSTPKPIPFIRELAKRADVHVTTGSTYDNPWLPGLFRRRVESRFEGTRRGRQELHGELLDDNPRAAFRRTWIERARLRELPTVYDSRGRASLLPLEQIVVAIDPQATTDDDEMTGQHAETGIVVAGRAQGRYYVLDDLSLDGTPHEWASGAIAGYNIHRANRIIGERNNGGDMVRATVLNEDPNVPFSDVWASRGKLTRAEPVSLLYEKGLVHHIGQFAELEDQMCEWEPGEPSPDRMDALVWALSYLGDLNRAVRKVELRERF